MSINNSIRKHFTPRSTYFVTEYINTLGGYVISSVAVIGAAYKMFKPESGALSTTFWIVLLIFALVLIAGKSLRDNIRFVVPNLKIEFDSGEEYIMKRTPLGQEASYKSVRIGIRNVTKRDMDNCLVVLEELNHEGTKTSPAIAFTTQNQRNQGRQGPFRLRPGQRKFVEIARKFFKRKKLN